jgi:methyl-accepting chemotaxis protein
MLKNLSLQKKLALSLGFIILINVTTGLFIFYSATVLQKAQNTLLSAQEARAQALGFSETLGAADRALFEFINYGVLEERDIFLETWKTLVEKEPALKEAVSFFDTSLISSLEGAYHDLDLWYQNFASKQIEFMKKPETVDLARAYGASAENQALHASIEEKMAILTKRIDERTAEKTQEQKTVMDRTKIAVIVGSLITVFVCVTVTAFLINSVSRPLARLVAVTNELINKNWSVTIDGTDRGDEVGQMANALLQFRDNGQENERLQAEQAKEDEQRLERARKIEALVASFREDAEQATSALERATQDMKSASVSLSQIARETSNLSMRVTQAANDTGANVQSVSAAAEELTASIREISEQLNRTSSEAMNAQQATESAVGKMKTLEDAVNSVGSIIQIISDIAEQTNLLALNATIESARAGEAGKGFAVVANEVKSLANETGKATEQVRIQIEEMQKQTAEAVEMIENISRVIEDLTAAAASIAAAMEEQSSATQEISRNVAEAAHGTGQVVQNIQQVSAATEETGQTSVKVSSVSEELAQKSDSLKDSIHKFIESIKAA